MGKRCIALDMGSDKGRAVMRRLIAGADVVVANFSPGALRHFGLDYDSLRAIKDDIILTTASAYHSEGPLAERIGFDGVGQAVSGAIWLSGLPGQPFRSATAFVDFGTALSCAYGTLGAIIRKMRTGKGSLVEASLVGTAMAIMNQILIEEATGYNHRVPTGNRSPIAGPSDVFMARDGWFIMQVIGGRMFHRWCKLVGRPNLHDDPCFATDILRGKNGEELSRIMAEWSAVPDPRGVPERADRREHRLRSGAIAGRGDRRPDGPDGHFHAQGGLPRLRRNSGCPCPRAPVRRHSGRALAPTASGRTHRTGSGRRARRGRDRRAEGRRRIAPDPAA